MNPTAAERALPTVRVVVADDDDNVRIALVELLGDEPDIEIVAQAADGSEAIEQCLALLPDVLVVDVNMPQGGGENAAHVLSVELPSLRIVAISANSDRVTRRRMSEAGALTFIAKGQMGMLADVVRHACP